MLQSQTAQEYLRERDAEARALRGARPGLTPLQALDMGREWAIRELARTWGSRIGSRSRRTYAETWTRMWQEANPP